MRVKIQLKDLLEMVYWARRYCDGRSTYSPSSFNNAYESINYDTLGQLRIHDKEDKSLMNEGEFWPYAQDGMYNEESGRFDARPNVKKQGEFLQENG